MVDEEGGPKAVVKFSWSCSSGTSDRLRTLAIVEGGKAQQNTLKVDTSRLTTRDLLHYSSFNDSPCFIPTIFDMSETTATPLSYRRFPVSEIHHVILKGMVLVQHSG